MKTQYVAGWNIPGYLLGSIEFFEEWEDARGWLISEIELGIDNSESEIIEDMYQAIRNLELKSKYSIFDNVELNGAFYFIQAAV